jgi:predicted MFS family arabinose efflux permease
VLRHGAYRRLWLAAVVSRAGDTLNFVALPLFVYAVTRSAAAVGALVIVEIAGAITGALLANPFVDRSPPRSVLIGADGVRLVAAAALAVAPSPATAYIAAFVLAVATAVFSPTSAALVPRLVPADDLQTANGLQWTAGVILQLVIAPLGGLLVASASIRVPFAINAASFAASALILTGVPHHAALAIDRSGLRQLPDAVRAFGRSRLLPPLLAMQALAALAVGATSALLVVLAQQGYGLSATGYGLWLGAIGLGALIGPLLLAALRGIAAGTVVTGAYAIRGAGDILLALLPSAAAAAGVLAIYGVNTSSGMVAFQTMVQRGTAAELRGRAFALLDAVWQAGRLLSIAAGAFAVAAFGIRALYVAGGALLLLAAAVGAFRLRGQPAPSVATAAAAPGMTRGA